MTPIQRRVLTAAFWLTVAAMGAVYLTSPAIGPLWSRQLGPWYRAAAELARGESAAGRIAARHARQAILTRETLPSTAAEKNAEWFARWDQPFLAYHRAELAKLTRQITTSASTLKIDLNDAISSGRSALTGGKFSGGDGQPYEFIAPDQSRLMINLDRPVSPREFQQINLGLIPVHSDAAGRSLCTADAHIRIIWFSADRSASFSEEQSAIVPLSSACGHGDGIILNLAHRFDWLSIGQVDRLWILFRASGEPLQFKTKSE